MKQSIIDCDAELRLGLGSPSAEPENHTPQQRNITIFYDGEVRVCDVTEVQARSIISIAKREMEERNCTHRRQELQPCLPLILNQGLSMKSSLQRFLQKRKSRTADEDSGPCEAQKRNNNACSTSDFGSSSSFSPNDGGN